MNNAELFKQCNYHLVETDKKRDQVIVFFTTVVGAFVVLADDESQLAAYFLLALVILGFVLGALLVQYRKWHIRYVNSVKILIRCMGNESSAKPKTIQAMKSLAYKDLGLIQPKNAITREWVRRYFQGVEVLTFQAFLLVAFVPVHFSIQQLGIGIPTDIHWVVPLLGNLAAYLFFANVYAVYYLSHDFRTRTPFALWVLPNKIGDALKKAPESAN